MSRTSQFVGKLIFAFCLLLFLPRLPCMKLLAFWTAKLLKSISASEETFCWHENWRFFFSNLRKAVCSCKDFIYGFISPHVLVLYTVGAKKARGKSGERNLHGIASAPAINLSSFIIACKAPQQQLHSSQIILQLETWNLWTISIESEDSCGGDNKWFSAFPENSVLSGDGNKWF